MRRTFLRAELAVALLLAIGSSAIFAGCAGRSRYYDVDARDYHRWNRDEIRFYVRWEQETRREHRELRRREAEEQRAYWRWRHEHHD
jgi:hypothetical protein